MTQIHDVIMANHGGIIVGHTFTGHTAACAGALAVQTIIERENLCDKVLNDGLWFGAQLEHALGDHPNVGNVRGRGFFWGTEFVQDKGSKKPFNSELNLMERMKLQALSNGLVCYPVHGFVEQSAGDAASVARLREAGAVILGKTVTTEFAMYTLC